MVYDHGILYLVSSMEEIAISKFKATCLAVLEKVRKTGKPVLVTRFGQPVAEVVPPPVKRTADSEARRASRAPHASQATSFPPPVMRMIGKSFAHEAAARHPYLVVERARTRTPLSAGREGNSGHEQRAMAVADQHLGIDRALAKGTNGAATRIWKRGFQAHSVLCRYKKLPSLTKWPERPDVCDFPIATRQIAFCLPPPKSSNSPWSPPMNTC